VIALPQYLGLVRAAETQLANALTLVADRHSADADVRDTAHLLARWSRRHVEMLEPAIDRYSIRDVPDAERLRAGLFQGARVGGVGLLRDVNDLLALGAYLRGTWTAVFQAAMELHDLELANIATLAAEDVNRQLAWIKTRVRMTATQALTVPPHRSRELWASIPKIPTAASLPDALWAPIAGAVLVGFVGVLALLAGQPWLLPSLGPTAYLLAQLPAQPSGRAYNVLAGHLLGLAAGIVAVWATGAVAAPIVLETGTLSGARVAAAVLAVALTVIATIALAASHPPAAATTLLVALGSLRTPQDAVNVAIGAAIMAMAGAVLRRLRLGQWPYRRATHAPAQAGAPAETQPVAPELKKAA
jgi:HPP family protein